MPSIYTYPRIDELSLKNLLIVSEAGGRNSRGVVYSTKSTTLGEIVELVVDTLAVGDFDEGIRNSQIDIQTDLLSLKSDTTILKSRIDDVEGGMSTYATNTRVDEVKSTLEGSIASSTLSLEAGYRSYTDDALTSYSTSTATQQLIAEATADKATSQSVTDLSSEIYGELGNYSTTTATQSLITAATQDKATAQSVTDLSAEIYGELGNYSTTTATQALITTATADKATSQSVTDLSSRIFDPTTNTLSQSFANSVMTTESTTDYAEASDVTELQSQFTFDTTGSITGTSGALNTEIAAASANTSQAFATKVANLEAQFALNNGVPDGLSSSNIQAIQTVIAGDGYATSTDITTLNSAIGQNSADISTVNTTIANETSARVSAISALQTDVNGNTADISSNTTAISNETAARISADQTLQTDVNNNTAGISNNATLISNETSARASAISALQTDVNGNAADIASNLTAISNETSARVAAVQTLTTDVAGNAADISSNTTAISNEESARISADQALQTSVDGNTANISNNASAISTETSARASAISALQTTVNGNTASITSNATAISNEASARASDVSGLQSSINGNTASIGVNQSTIATVDGKLNSSYAINVDANGVVAGLKLLSNGTTSDMEFAADKFKFTNGSGTLTPFSIDTVNNKINFTGDVVFSSSYGDSDVQSYIDTVGEIFTTTTTISGGQIETGLIKNSTYPHSAGHSGYATTGMAVDLDNGSIHAEKFYINADGTSNFKGIHEAGRLGNWVVTNNALKSGYNNPAIVLDPTGNYPKTGYGEITIAATNLPSITPVSYVNTQFTGNQGNMATASTINSSGNIVFSDIVEYAQASVADNTTYNTTSSSVIFKFTGFTPQKRGAINLDIPLDLVASGYEQGYTNQQTCEPEHPDVNISAPISYDYKLTAEIIFTITRPDSSTYTQSYNQILADRNTQKDVGSTISPDNGIWADYAGTFDQYGEPNSCGPWDFSYDDVYGGTFAGPADAIEGTLNNLEINSQIKVTQFKLKHEWKNLTVETIQSSSYTGPKTVTASAHLSENSGLQPVVFRENSGTDKRVVLAENGLQVKSNDGYAAIGDITAGENVAEFWGDIQIAGDTSSYTTSVLAASSFSDKRLKENIKEIEDPINIVNQLAPVKYDWKSNLSSRKDLSVKLEDKYGFLAQEVKEVIPTAILQNKNKIHGIENPLSVEYNNIIAINTAAIKELITKINELEKEIQTLRNT